ncbi:methyl-accepting chemotaxis protein [Modestobacter sp. NPDC049651]|uniref:methyl-accepting chemotaxis protein n=1 Tax=unclassified Modestobacter TaxID=2643866 RepID=UPI00340B215F
MPTTPAPQGAPARRRSTPGAWWADRPVAVKVLTGVGAASLVAAVIGVSGLVALSAEAGTSERLYHEDVLGIDGITALISDVKDVANAQQAAVLATTPQATTDALQRSSEARDRFGDHLDDFLALDHPGETEDALTEVEQTFTRAGQVEQGLLASLAQQHDPAAWTAVHDAQVKPLYDEALAGLVELEELESADAAANAAQARADSARQRTFSVMVLVVGVLVALTIGLLVARGVARTVRRVEEVAQALARGDLTRSTGMTSRDELGRMGAAIDAALAQLRGVMAGIVASSSTVAASAEELSASAGQISASAEETSTQATVVSAAAEEVSRSIETVAAGSEEMNAAISEISKGAAEAARVAGGAVVEAGRTNASVQKLGDSSREIGEVVKVITSIAEQTSLLALNATIEAARAGEAGKGFAVVASEVKELAEETARATDDISRRVAAIQTDTGAAVEAIGRITDVVGSINDFQLTIASAVEEQTATTNEMARSVAEGATGASEIAANITGVSQASESTTAALGQTRIAVDELSRLASDLRVTVSQFTF